MCSSAHSSFCREISGYKIILRVQTHQRKKGNRRLTYFTDLENRSKGDEYGQRAKASGF